MFKIGDVCIDNAVVAAPMAGVTDQAFRIILKSFGAGLVVSEMISDMGLVHQQERTLRMIDITGETPPVAVQIFGSQPEPMAIAASEVANKGAAIIDINMGCPTPKIVKNGEGSALMRDIPRSRTIIRAVVEAVKIPVTVKMRLGWDADNKNCLDLAQAAQEEGAAAVTLHARTRDQYYSGTADWSYIRQLKQQLTIPVIGNGDIWSAQDALRMKEETGCDAVMIGRATMGNPFIIRKSVALLEKNLRLEHPNAEERITTAIKHLELVCEFKGEAVGVREMRKHFSWYIKGMRGAARLREEINRATTRQQLIDLIRILIDADNAD
ncbi:MAG: tRNA dihydrouridine synthase DusB [Syntrophomonadaceae bacterium]|jgi:tRNA-dihydrouridine synthase B